MLFEVEFLSCLEVRAHWVLRSWPLEKVLSCSEPCCGDVSPLKLFAPCEFSLETFCGLVEPLVDREFWRDRRQAIISSIHAQRRIKSCSLLFYVLFQLHFALKKVSVLFIFS